MHLIIEQPQKRRTGLALADSDLSLSAALALEARQNLRLYYAVAYGILREGSAAEDACQNGFVRALERDEPPENLKAWLVQVVTNEALQILRRRKLEQKTAAEQLKAQIEHKAPDVDSVRNDLIETGLARLPEPIQTVVVLRTLRGMSGEEAAGFLGCSTGQVSKLFRDGLDRLRHVMTERSKNHAM